MNPNEKDALIKAFDIAARLEPLLQEMKMGFLKDTRVHNENLADDSEYDRFTKTILEKTHMAAHSTIEATVQFWKGFGKHQWIDDMMTTLTLFEAARIMADHIQRRSADMMIQNGEDHGIS